MTLLFGCFIFALIITLIISTIVKVVDITFGRKRRVVEMGRYVPKLYKCVK